MEQAGPPPPDSTRREDVREAVRVAMLKLLGEKPFKDLTIDEIARAAGLSRTAFYFYFKNKVEVLTVVLEEVASALYSEADRWWSGDGPPEQLVREALEGTARVYDEHAEIVKVAIEVTNYDEGFAAFYRQLTERFVAEAAEQIREEQQAGLARDLDAERTAEALVYMFERTCHVLISIERRPVGPVVDAMVPVWLHTVYSDSALSARPR